MYINLCRIQGFVNVLFHYEIIYLNKIKHKTLIINQFKNQLKKNEVIFFTFFFKKPNLNLVGLLLLKNVMFTGKNKHFFFLTSCFSLYLN